MIKDTDQLTREQAAEVLGISPRNLAEMARRRQGPPYYKLSRKILRYTCADVLRWREGQIVEQGPRA